ncbi:MAG: YggT family protein [Candidatus Dojkabacteria bacterium]|nr:MAG: YggT family protein [Candidatus Dojkabacteria bacterium]
MLFRFLAQIGYTLLIVIETLLSLRFIFKFLNISGNNRLVGWLYNTTDKAIAPFQGIVPESVSILGFTLELTTMLALFVLMLIAYALYEIIKAYS